MTPWLVLSPSPPGRFDGIGDHAWHLARALDRRGAPAELVVREPRGGSLTDDLPPVPLTHAVRSWRRLTHAEWEDRSRAAAGAIVHYVPQAYAHTDFAALLRWVSRVGDARRPVIVTLHELWVPTDGRARRAVLRAIHKRMLVSLLGRAHRVVVTSALAARMLDDEGLSAGREVRVIPVGPNVEPDAGPAAEAPEAAETMLVLFGQPAGMHVPTLRALGRWLDGTPRPIRLCWFGRSPAELRQAWSGAVGLPGGRVEFAGGLSAPELSARIRPARLALAPYVDGVSTRRSSLATLLAHHLPVVGLDGLSTDPLQRESGAFLLNDANAPAAFVAHIEALLDDAPRRARMSAAAAHLCETTLSWDRIAAAYLDLAGAPAVTPVP